MFLRLLPLLQREAESIQLRFEFGETLFQVRTLLMHRPPCARDVTRKTYATLHRFATLRLWLCADRTSSDLRLDNRGKPSRIGPRGAPMTVRRMTRRVVVALALDVLIAASDVAAQDPLARAKDLYASAAYDEALAVLDQLDSSPANAVEAGQYRAFCLLALGRSDEGRKAIAGIV